MVDLAVVGAGPAGATTALLAARHGANVALFDPTSKDADKPCGEGIMASGVDALSALGVDDLHELGRPFSTIRYRVPGAAPLEVALPRAGLALSRPELQLRLHGLLDLEPRVQRIAVAAQVTRAESGFSIQTRAGSWQARTLAVADGPGGTTASWLRAPTSHAGRIGLRARFKARRLLDSVEVLLGKQCELYLTPLPAGLVNVAALFERAPRGARGTARWLELALQASPASREWLGELHTPPSARPLGRRQPRVVAAQSAFLVGDAGGGTDPILGCGVTIAVRTGIAAAEGAIRVLRGETDGSPEADYSRRYRQETRARRALASVLRAAAPHPGLMRGVVALGRGIPPLLGPLVRIVAGESTAA